MRVQVIDDGEMKFGSTSNPPANGIWLIDLDPEYYQYPDDGIREIKSSNVAIIE